MEYLFVYGAKWGEIKEKETTKRWQEIGKDVGIRDMNWERQTRGDMETRLHRNERETQGACADHAPSLPFSRYLLRIYKAKLCIY